MPISKETLIERGLKKNSEIEGNPASIGVALAIVGIDPSRNGDNIARPKLWTVKELKSKAATEKIVGQISFPAETRKEDEQGNKYPVNNIIGALVDEFSDNRDLIRNSLFLVSGLSVVRNKIEVASGPLDLVVLVYGGPLDRRINPTDIQDVEANGWMTLEELHRLNPKDLRNFVWQTIRAETSDGIISNVVNRYFHFPLERIPIAAFLPEDFSTEGFHAKREQGKDVVGNISLQNAGVLFGA